MRVASLVRLAGTQMAGRAIVAAVLAALVVAGGPGRAVGAAPGRVPAGPTAASSAGAAIGPHQHFVALVNGRRSAADILVVCAGPVYPGRTGPPAGDQVVAVHRVRAGTTGAGDTGATGTSVVATQGAAATTALLATFTSYGSVTLANSVQLPCDGTGVVLFAPAPGSRSAVKVAVDVTFENIAV